MAEDASMSMWSAIRDCDEALRAVRHTASALFKTAEITSLDARVIARRLGVSRAEAYELLRLLESESSLTGVLHVPDPETALSVMAGARAAGADHAVIHAFHQSAKDFDRLANHLVGDRAALLAMLDGIDFGRDGEVARFSRKLAFQGLSGVLGVQAETRLGAWFIAPSAATRGHADLVHASGHFGLRALRDEARCTAFQGRAWGAIAYDEGPAPWVDLFRSGCPAGAPKQAEDDCAGPAFDDTDHGEGPEITLALTGGAPVDAWRVRRLDGRAPMTATEEDGGGNLGVTFPVPARRLLFEVFVHEDLAHALKGEARAFARTFSDGVRATTHPSPHELATPPTVERLGGVEGHDAAGLKGYKRIVGRVFDRAGWDRGRFRCLRVRMEYPPQGGSLYYRFPLIAPARLAGRSGVAASANH